MRRAAHSTFRIPGTSRPDGLARSATLRSGIAAAKPTVREPIALVIVIDDDGLGSLPLVEAALDNLGQRDRVALVDSASDGRTAVPLVPVYLGNLARILPKGAALPVPMQGRVVFGPELHLATGEDKQAFLARCRQAVLELAEGGP